MELFNLFSDMKVKYKANYLKFMGEENEKAKKENVKKFNLSEPYLLMEIIKRRKPEVEILIVCVVFLNFVFCKLLKV